jgi:predicted transposase YdaD
MELFYNITEDPLYQEGIEKGMEKGVRNLIINMLRDKTLSMEKIAELARVTIGYVQQVAKELKE